MSISSDIIRGNTETIILAQLLEKDSYGYEISKTVQVKSQNRFDLKEATLYSAFRRLEANCYIESYWGGEEKGARRRYYKITDVGKQAYKKNKADWDEAKEIIDQLLV